MITILLYFFLIVFPVKLYSQEFPDLHISWSVLPNPLQPNIRVKIEYTQDIDPIITESFVDANLTVRENAWIILTCMATYRVMWFKDSEV